MTFRPRTRPRTFPPRGPRDVSGRHDAEHRGGDVERLAEPIDDVEDDEGAHAGEGRLPRGVRDQEAAHVLLPADDAPGCRQDRPEALVAGRFHIVLVDEHDHRAACDQRDTRGEDERERLPDGEQEAAADERRAERDTAQDVLDALARPK